mgnify:CR=1 FL=1
MKRLILILTMLLPFAASADFIARCDPPSTKTASKAASTTASAIVRHLKNIDQIRAGVPAAQRVLPQFDAETSADIIAGHSRMCYQFFKAGNSVQCDYSIPASLTPFPAPAVCVWSRLSATDQAKVRALGVGP